MSKITAAETVDTSIRMLLGVLRQRERLRDEGRAEELTQLDTELGKVLPTARQMRRHERPAIRKAHEARLYNMVHITRTILETRRAGGEISDMSIALLASAAGVPLKVASDAVHKFAVSPGQKFPNGPLRATLDVVGEIEGIAPENLREHIPTEQPEETETLFGIGRLMREHPERGDEFARVMADIIEQRFSGAGLDHDGAKMIADGILSSIRDDFA